MVTRDNLLGRYILVGKKTVPCLDPYTWGTRMEEDRRVARTNVFGMSVSTVFLGLDHSFNRGPSLLFETMIFGINGRDCYTDRYGTWDEAVKGHGRAVRWAMPVKHKVLDFAYMWQAPEYKGADTHMFVIAHWNDDAYFTSNGIWTKEFRFARTFSHEETRNFMLPEDGRWLAFGRRFNL